ncbi:hypothetical protein Dimus_021384 [Dionaea muscipula]
MAAVFDFEIPLADTLIKVAMFVLVQALVYLILSSSSNIFSSDDNKNSKMAAARSLSFRSSCSGSIRRISSLFSDLPELSSELLESSKVPLPTIEKEHPLDAEEHS